MVRIRLRRMGSKHRPAYRVVIADARAPRDGKFIETIGHYNPQLQPKVLVIKQDRARYWLSVGAQPSETVVRLLRNVGVMDKEGKVLAAVETETPVVEVQAPVAQKPRRRAPETPATEATAPVAVPQAPTFEAPAAPALVASVPVAEAAAPAGETAGESAAGPYGAGSAAANADGSAPTSFTIKGNASSMLYHVEGTRYYESTDAEVWFASPADAERAGFRAPDSNAQAE